MSLPTNGWRLPTSNLSLPEVHGSIAIPHGAGFWRKMFAFAGPGYLVAVGYMDPGNWATDLAGGARYGYTLLSVIMISNLMAILLQAALSARSASPAAATGPPAATAIPRPTVYVLWLLCKSQSGVRSGGSDWRRSRPTCCLACR
jgi:manganese transport protein